MHPPVVSRWTRANCIGIAKDACTFCHGAGLRAIRYGREVPCECTFRQIFRACYSRYRQCVVEQGSVGQSVGERAIHSGGGGGPGVYGFKRTEFIADFCLIANRTLTAPLQREVFRLHYLEGAEWRLCCQELGITRGHFFRSVYVVEERLGRVFGELQPYGLWPLDEYFGKHGAWKPEPLLAMAA